MNHIRILGLLLLSMNLQVGAQEISLSNADLWNRVVEANTDLKMTEAAYQEAQGEYRQTNALFIPSITASHTEMRTTNPLMAFGSKLNQAILTPADFNPELLNDPDATTNFATKIEVNQPLINLDGFYQRRAAKFKMLAASLQRDRRREYLQLETRQVYMQLQLTHKGVSVIKKALKAAKENQNVAELNTALGYLQKSDLLAVNVRVLEIENQLQSAISQVLNASDYISYLMRETPGATYFPIDSLYAFPALETQGFKFNASRSDIQAMEYATLAHKNMLTADKMTFLPRLNAFGSYELYDNRLFKFGASGYTVGAQLSWNILEGSKRFGKTQSSQAAYDKAVLAHENYIASSRLELERAKRAYADAVGKMQSTRLALEQSQEALRIRSNRFREGLERTADLLSAETAFAQKELEFYQTVFEHNYTLAYLEFLVSNPTTQNP